MVDDLSDLTKNKLTVADRVEIVKKIGKELGFETSFDQFSRVYSNFSQDISNDSKEEKFGEMLDDFIEYFKNQEKNGVVYFMKPSMIVDVSNETARIRISIDKPLEKQSDSCLEGFYEKIKDKHFISLAYRDNGIDYSTFVPRVSDEYYEQILRLYIRLTNYMTEDIVEKFETYKELIDED